MKEKIMNNWNLKLLSLAISIVIWLTVVNYDNPYTTRTISGIPIEITNEDVLTGNNMIYAVVGGQSASVRVRCPRKTAESLRSTDFKAVADFRDMYTLTNQVPISISCTNPRVTNDEITLLTQSLEVEIETVETKKMDVRPVITGEPVSGYKVGEVTCSPSSIRVTAPSSFLDQISYVGVPISVDGISQTMNLSEPVVFYSAGGNPLDTSSMQHLTVSTSVIDVEVEILNVKSVNINYTVTGQEEVAFGYLYSGVELSQSSVQISGRRSDLAGISAITIPEGELDLTGASANVEKSFDLRSLLPEGASLLEGEDYNLKVVLKVEKLATKEYALGITNLDIQNLPAGLEIGNTDLEVLVTVQGLAGDMEALKPSEIEAVLDLKGLEIGMHSVEVHVTVPHGFSLVGTPRALVRLVDPKTVETTGANPIGLPTGEEVIIP